MTAARPRPCWARSAVIFCFELRRRQAVVGAGVDRDAVGGECTALPAQHRIAIDSRRLAARIDDRHDRQLELPGKLEIALVVRRHGHDRAGAVAGQHIVGDPDRHRLVVDRIDGIRAGEDAGLFLGQSVRSRSLLRRRLARSRPSRVGVVRAWSAARRADARRDDHVSCAEQRVGPGRVDPQHVVVGLRGKAALRAPALPRLEFGRCRLAVGIRLACR